MTVAPPIAGLHHVTAISSDAQRTLDFHARVLGLRLVKRAVNLDDPRTLHLYLGDATGAPGTVLTYFVWPGAGRGQQGTGQAAVVSFAVRPEAIGTWVVRLVRHGVPYEGPTSRGGGAEGERVLSFRDPDGLLLELVARDDAAARPAWSGLPDLDAADGIRGLHGVTLWLEDGEATARRLGDALGFRESAGWERTRRFVAGDGPAAARVDVRTVGGFARGAEGAGTVHHVAWRVSDDAALLAWRERLVAAGEAPTAVRERFWFRSVYFREADGVLHELATDGPGFLRDEPADALGAALALPPWLEPRRAELEAALAPLHLPGAADPGRSAFALPEDPA